MGCAARGPRRARAQLQSVREPTAHSPAAGAGARAALMLKTSFDTHKYCAALQTADASRPRPQARSRTDICTRACAGREDGKTGSPHRRPGARGGLARACVLPRISPAPCRLMPWPGCDAPRSAPAVATSGRAVEVDGCLFGGSAGSRLLPRARMILSSALVLCPVVIVRTISFDIYHETYVLKGWFGTGLGRTGGGDRGRWCRSGRGSE